MPLTNRVINFGSFVVTSQPGNAIDWYTQVFHQTRLSFAIVNLKPLLPGHVLVSPCRVVPRFNDLSTAEVQDLFLTVQRVSRMVERVFSASSMNIAIQDGVDAGQSVPHVHVHIIPRKKADLDDRGGTDAIYGMMESEDADLSKQLSQKRDRFPAVDNDSRKPRTDEEMHKEAEWLAQEMAADGHGQDEPTTS
ncbi:hit domain-containing protein [Curvularia clavata]|uniref:Bis(5'-adenosyl)-triphosphatase n=1 Tax=Curvularia clavata TaxID=95742 RepID=A0A9Q9DNL6_CURCL|nr:hit domain-containing protein [Curvularia clavata]